MGNNKEEIQGFCRIGYTNFSSARMKYTGEWSDRSALPREDTTIPLDYKPFKANEWDTSGKLVRISQLNGILMPKPNTGIGAPQCTFTYGGIAPGESPFFTKYIQGPTTGYGPFTWAGELMPGENIDKQWSEDNADEEDISDTTNNLTDVPTIPVNALSSQYNTSKKPVKLTTYNIWKLKLSTKIQKKYKFKYKKNYGCMYDDKNYKGPYLYQTFDNNTVSAVVIAPPKHRAEVERIFPISEDLMYENNCLLYHPNKDYDPRQIKVNENRENCGFHLRFLHNNIADYDADKNGSQIVITWGTADTSKNPYRNKITKFMLHICPHNATKLAYLNPVPNPTNGKLDWQFSSILKCAPDLGNQDVIDVFVHFVGPVMMIGFTEDPQHWDVFGPVSAVDNPDNHYFPQLPPESKISIIFENITTHFQYSPIAFDNYNASQPTDLMANRYKVGLQIETENEFAELKNNLKKYAYLNKNKTDHDGLEDYHIAPTYYADWRSEPANQMELIHRPSGYYVKWDTTIEGPAFLSISDIPGEKKPSDAIRAINPKSQIIQTIPTYGDVTEYLTKWTVTYDTAFDNHSFLRGTATVTLENLALTPNGRKILSSLEEHVLLVTLGANCIDSSDITNTTNVPATRTFFQGYVLTSSTTYSKSGSTTTLNCSDIASRLFDDCVANDAFIFVGCRYRNCVQTAAQLVGLTKHFTCDLTPFNDGGANNRWGYAVNARIARGLYLSSSAINEVLSVSISDPELMNSLVKKVMESINNINTFPVLYWNPEEERLILTAKQSDISGKYEELSFLGEGNDIPIPNDKHGIIVENYTIESNNQMLSDAYVFWTKLIDGPTNITSANDPSFPPSLPDPENPPRQRPWVGFPKTFAKCFVDQFKQTQFEAEFYAHVYDETFLRTCYQNIRFKVYVTRPLRPWSMFKIKTLSAKGNNVTDPYFYKQLIYSFDKKTNIITADITGETQPGFLGALK